MNYLNDITNDVIFPQCQIQKEKKKLHAHKCYFETIDTEQNWVLRERFYTDILL